METEITNDDGEVGTENQTQNHQIYKERVLSIKMKISVYKGNKLNTNEVRGMKLIM